jgi:hypothetical protein
MNTWQQIAEEFGGRYEDGCSFGSPVVQVPCGEWTIVLDTFTQQIGRIRLTSTRMHAVFIPLDDSRFLIYRNDIVSTLRKLFGMQDIEVGFPELDNALIIKGNRPHQVRRYFDDSRLRQRLIEQPNVDLELLAADDWYRAKSHEELAQLRLTTSGVVQDLAQLRQLFNFFGCALDRLAQIGLASAEAPSVHSGSAPVLWRCVLH